MDWNNIIKHPLFLIGAVAAIVIAFYYIVSPYQNCVRDKNAWFARAAQEGLQLTGRHRDGTAARGLCRSENLSW